MGKGIFFDRSMLTGFTRRKLVYAYIAKNAGMLFALRQPFESLRLRMTKNVSSDGFGIPRGKKYKGELLDYAWETLDRENNAYSLEMLRLELEQKNMLSKR
jgi:hypothetical protein